MPSEDLIRSLEPGQFVVENNEVCVRVQKSGTQLHFTCPFCYTRYRKDGFPYARAKNLEHHHGLPPEYRENTPFDLGSRQAHCDSAKPDLNVFPKGLSGFRLFYLE